jgi:hypothetical protein
MLPLPMSCSRLGGFEVSRFPGSTDGLMSMKDPGGAYNDHKGQFRVLRAWGHSTRAVVFHNYSCLVYSQHFLSWPKSIVSISSLFPRLENAFLWSVLTLDHRPSTIDHWPCRSRHTATAAMILNARQSTAFHHNRSVQGRDLSAEDREKELKTFLPPTPASSSNPPSETPSPYPSRAPSRRPGARRKMKSARKKPIRSALKNQFYVVVYTVLLTVFGVFVRLRKAYHAVVDRVFAILYHHHRTPDLIRKDVKSLSKVPEHLSVILRLNDEEDRNSALRGLVNEVGEIAAWSASAGIPVLSVYEKTGWFESSAASMIRAL